MIEPLNLSTAYPGLETSQYCSTQPKETLVGIGSVPPPQCMNQRVLET